MNIQDLLEAEMNKLRRLNPEVHALLERIFQYKDGKGDYSVDRHRWLETLDEETFLNEVHQYKGKLGEYKAAITDYDRAIDLKPNYVDAYYN